MKKLALSALVAAVAVGLLATAAAGTPAKPDGARWKVTITNLTPPGGGPPGSQPLSPPLFAVHTAKVDVWSVGTIANHGVAAIAEDANNAPLESALEKVRGVSSVFTGEGGPIPSGGSATYMVRTKGSADRLTVLTMLVNTNDGLTGLDARRLEGARTVVRTMSYDAGSERNNELKAFIPGPCCGSRFARDPEGDLIRMHPGIKGIGDLDPDLYGWNEPVARITIERA